MTDSKKGEDDSCTKRELAMDVKEPGPDSKSLTLLLGGREGLLLPFTCSASRAALAILIPSTALLASMAIQLGQLSILFSRDEEE